MSRDLINYQSIHDEPGDQCDENASSKHFEIPLRHESVYDMQNPTTVYPRLEIVQQKLVPDEFVMRQSANADDGCLGRPRPRTGSCENFEEGI